MNWFYRACVLVVTLGFLSLVFSINSYLKASLVIQEKAAENGRFLPYDVRNEHYGWDGGKVQVSTRKFFDTRTGAQFLSNGMPSN